MHGLALAEGRFLIQPSVDCSASQGNPTYTFRMQVNAALWRLSVLLSRSVAPLILLAALVLGNAGSAVATEIEVFVREGCPHCEAAKHFLHELVPQRPDMRIVFIDVRRDPGAVERLTELSRKAGIAQPGVPSFRIGATLIVGFDTPASTGAEILAALDSANLTDEAGEAGKARACGIANEPACQAPREQSVEIPFLGWQVGVEQLGLPLFTVIIGLLDGFNPCSIWVLVLMISMLASLGDRRRMLAIAGTFVLVQGMAYFAFMAAWLNLFLLIGISRISEIAIAVLAIVAGTINLKDFVAFGRGISLSIPSSAKPGIYARLRAILRAEQLWPAIAGTLLLAVLVQIIELMCTSGFPALYTRILTLRQLDSASYYGYLLLYNLMYMLDDVLILAVGVVTLSQRRLQENEGRVLKLLSGVVMLGLGVYLLIAA